MVSQSGKDWLLFFPPHRPAVVLRYVGYGFRWKYRGNSTAYAKIPAPQRVRILSDRTKIQPKIGLCGFPNSGMHVATVSAKVPWHVWTATSEVRDLVSAWGERRRIR